MTARQMTWPNDVAYGGDVWRATSSPRIWDIAPCYPTHDRPLARHPKHDPYRDVNTGDDQGGHDKIMGNLRSSMLGFAAPDSPWKSNSQLNKAFNWLFGVSGALLSA